MTDDIRKKKKEKKIRFNEYSIKSSDITNNIPDNITFNEFDVELNIPKPNSKKVTFTQFSIDKKINNTQRLDGIEFNEINVESGQLKIKISDPVNSGLYVYEKMLSEDNLYLSEGKLDVLYREILLYLIELRFKKVKLKKFLKSIWSNANARKSTISELFERINVEKNQYNDLQLNVTLLVLIYATFFIPDFYKLSDDLASRFKKHSYTVKKIIEDAISGFSSIANLGLYNLSLNDLKNLKKSDFINDTENEEEYSHEKNERLFNEDANIIPELSQTFVNNEMETIINIDRENIPPLLKERGIEGKTFHHRIDYDFKWAKHRFLVQDSKIPMQLRSLLYNYFTYLMKGDDFKIFMKNVKTFSCSSLKVQYLKQGARKKVFSYLKKSGFIKEYSRKNLLESDFPFLYGILESTAKIEDFMKENKELNKDRHERVESFLLLESDNVIAIEPPIWDKSTYITGHIDLVMHANSTPIPILFLSDYKPNTLNRPSEMVRFLPQLCMYGLLMRKMLGFKKDFLIKCLMFNRNYVWIFDFDLIYKLPKIVEDNYDPKYFLNFLDIFGNVQDYLLISWSILCKLRGLHDPETKKFLKSVSFELSRLLNLKTESFIEIGKEILHLIQDLRHHCSSSQSENLIEIENATNCLFNLDFSKNEQDILMDFFLQFRFDIMLWEDCLHNSLEILHSIQKLCYVLSFCFKKKMIQINERYKVYLLYAYLISKQYTDNNYFTPFEIIYISDRSYSTFKLYNKILLKFNLIKKIGYRRAKGAKYVYLYSLTETGLTQAKMIINIWKNNFSNEFNDLTNKAKRLYDKWYQNEYILLDIEDHIMNEESVPTMQELLKQDPEFLKKVREGVKKHHKSLDFRDSQKEMMEEVWKRDGFKEMQSDIQEEVWKRDGYRESQIEKFSKGQKRAWQNPEIREQRMEGISKSAERRRIKITDVRQFLLDIKKSKKQAEVAVKHGMKEDDYSTFNKKIKEILGGFDIKNYNEARHFLEDRSIDEICNYLGHPNKYSNFKDPSIRDFLIDVKASAKRSDLYEKHGLLDDKALYRKIKRIVGKFGISNYTELKIFLQSDDIDKVLGILEDYEKRLDNNEPHLINMDIYRNIIKEKDIIRNNILNILNLNSRITTNRVAELLDLEYWKVYRYLNELEKENLLEKTILREGKVNKAYWKLKD